MLSSANVVAFKSLKLPFRQVLIRGTIPAWLWYHLVCSVVTQNHIVLIVFKGKLQISAFTSASVKNK
jgi:uncharacterized membrane protein (DUF106 family)